MKLPAFSGSTDHGDAARDMVVSLLWRAFPTHCEADLARRASRALGVSPRQVVNWLRKEHDPRWRHVAAMMVIAGAEVILRQVERHR